MAYNFSINLVETDKKPEVRKSRVRIPASPKKEDSFPFGEKIVLRKATNSAIGRRDVA